MLKNARLLTPPMVFSLGIDIMLLTIGGIIAYLIPTVGIPLCVAFFLLGLILTVWAFVKSGKANNPTVNSQQKPSTAKNSEEEAQVSCPISTSFDNQDDIPPNMENGFSTPQIIMTGKMTCRYCKRVFPYIYKGKPQFLTCPLCGALNAREENYK